MRRAPGPRVRRRPAADGAPVLHQLGVAAVREGLTAPTLLFVIGASGSGKTAAVRSLEARGLPGVRCYYFDSIGVPAPEEMERGWGSGERWQEDSTHRWVQRLVANADAARSAVLDGQTRPSFIIGALAQAPVAHHQIVLLDCTPAVRSARLRELRGQPELDTEHMRSWADYLRIQAHAHALPIIDTSALTIAQMADALAPLALLQDGR